MTEPIFYGYTGQVWAVVFAALNQFSQALGTASEPFDTLPMAEAVLDTALNGLAAINANRIAGLWTADEATFSVIQALPILPNPSDQAFFSARQQAVLNAATALQALVPTPNLYGVSTALSQGLAAIPDPGLLEFFGGFQYEAAPGGLTVNNLPAIAGQCSAAFADLAAVVAAVPGVGQNYLYDLLTRLSLEMSAFAELLGCFLGFSASTTTFLWNQMFVLPTMLAHADLLSSAPNNIITQQDQLIRFLIIYIVQQLQNFILTVDRPTAQPIELATILTGDSLMDVASRSLGDYTKWSEIATINKLQPPFIAPTSQPGVVGWGKKVVLPLPGGQPTPGFVPDYLLNFLGVDVYFGPINGDMPPWTGDFQLISGYDNIRWALGRRMQTTLGKLIYHPDYGCRIPPEVGNVQTNDTAGYIAAFGKSCLLSDPRVSAVPSATVSLEPNFALAFAGSVQLAGFGANPITINEVINSSLTPTTVARG